MLILCSVSRRVRPAKIRSNKVTLIPSASPLRKVFPAAVLNLSEEFQCMWLLQKF